MLLELTSRNPQTLFFLVSLTKKSLPEHHSWFTLSYYRQRVTLRTFNVPIRLHIGKPG